jgi:hypothetical protein
MKPLFRFKSGLRASVQSRPTGKRLKRQQNRLPMIARGVCSNTMALRVSLLTINFISKRNTSMNIFEKLLDHIFRLQVLVQQHNEWIFSHDEHIGKRLKLQQIV